MPKADHWLRGSWRTARHGPKPLTMAAVEESPTHGAARTPTAGDLAALGAAGRALLGRFMERYELSLTEGELLLEAARCADVLAALRVQALADMAAQRAELAWSKHFAALLTALRLEKP